MDARKIMRKVVVGAGLMTSLSGAYAHHGDQVQTIIGSSSLFPQALAADGSNCDPAVIEKNLDKLKQADVLEVTNLTLTSPAGGHCYGPCPEQVQAAVEEHCAKADKLAQIVELL